MPSVLYDSLVVIVTIITFLFFIWFTYACERL
jgi:hypothetical protein